MVMATLPCLHNQFRQLFHVRLEKDQSQSLAHRLELSELGLLVLDQCQKLQLQNLILIRGDRPLVRIKGGIQALVQIKVGHRVGHRVIVRIADGVKILNGAMVGTDGDSALPYGIALSCSVLIWCHALQSFHTSSYNQKMLKRRMTLTGHIVGLSTVLPLMG